MPNKCGVVNCKGNYNRDNRCPVFRLPKDRFERQQWLDVLPLRENFVVDSAKFFICEKHWTSDPPIIRPPSVFNVPLSCLPSSKPAPRPAKTEDTHLRYFLQKALLHMMISSLNMTYRNTTRMRLFQDQKKGLYVCS